MFFTGSLQEGIATALQQSKCVFCFVTGEYLIPPLATSADCLADTRIDEEAESQTWETEYLTEDSVSLTSFNSKCQDLTPLLRSQACSGMRPSPFG